MPHWGHSSRRAVPVATSEPRLEGFLNSGLPRCPSSPPSPGLRDLDSDPPRVPVATSEPRLEGFSNGGHARVPVDTPEPWLGGSLNAQHGGEGRHN